MLYAHFPSMANPGTFNQGLNKVLKLNNLPEIVTPDNPPSTKIITSLAESEPNKDDSINTNNQQENITSREAVEKNPTKQTINGEKNQPKNVHPEKPGMTKG